MAPPAAKSRSLSDGSLVTAEDPICSSQASGSGTRCPEASPDGFVSRMAACKRQVAYSPFTTNLKQAQIKIKTKHLWTLCMALAGVARCCCSSKRTLHSDRGSHACA